jgi:hypothetical protein
MQMRVNKAAMVQVNYMGTSLCHQEDWQAPLACSLAGLFAYVVAHLAVAATRPHRRPDLGSL